MNMRVVRASMAVTDERTGEVLRTFESDPVHIDMSAGVHFHAHIHITEGAAENRFIAEFQASHIDPEQPDSESEQ